jgi:Tfp pilus assembly protein PilF
MQASSSKTQSSGAQAMLDAGRKLLDRDQAAGALRILSEAAELEPDWAEPHYLLACAFHDLGRTRDAENAARKALDLQPDHSLSAHRLGVVLSEADRWPEARTWLQRSAELAPDRAIVQRDLAVALLFMGEVEQARQAFARAVDQGMWEQTALYMLVTLTPMNGDGREVSALWQTLNELNAREDLGIEERTELCFALGKAFADCGEVERASQAWAEGNRLKREGMDYSVHPTLDRWREIARIFDRSLIQRLEGQGGDTDRPIFICGLPRSGTTLVEQILCAHPQVLGGGEHEALARVVQSVRPPNGTFWPHWAGSMKAVDCRRLAEAYLDMSLQPGPGRSRVTDKRLENVETLGLIHLCLPRAPMIYVKRDPRDVALSCWSILFAGALPFTYDLTEMADYFEAHEQLMAHWRRVLPPGRLLEVPYEQLVADPEAWSRRIVTHCGLDWDERCLEPHKASRAVKTTSAAQVRQPVHAGSVGRWKPYAKALQPLIDRLDDVLPR